jgi:hypothetical protein
MIAINHPPLLDGRDVCRSSGFVWNTDIQMQPLIGAEQATSLAGGPDWI